MESFRVMRRAGIQEGTWKQQGLFQSSCPPSSFLAEVYSHPESTGKLKISFFRSCERKDKQEGLSQRQKSNSILGTFSVGRFSGVTGLLTDPQSEE